MSSAELSAPTSIVPLEGNTRASTIMRYRAKVIEHQQCLKSLKDSYDDHKALMTEFDKSEIEIKAIQTVGQNVGEILRKLDDDKYVVKGGRGSRSVVGIRKTVNPKKLLPGTRITLDSTTMTIMKILPREVSQNVHKMAIEDPGNVAFTEIGGLSEQIRQLREVIELPLISPELFKRVGIVAPKGCLLYGPPGTGKTLLARAVASQIKCNFLKVVASSIVEKYIGESSKKIREMFAYAKDHQPCVIFIDEIDAIGGRRFNKGSSTDRDVQRTLLELLSQIDGFDHLGQVKVIMATNRPDTLDPALVRPGRMDRKIHVELPNDCGRLEILKIYTNKMALAEIIDFEPIIKLSEGFNGADLRNVCTEAGLFAIRTDRDSVTQEDMMKAVRKVAENKKLETKLEYKKI